MICGLNRVCDDDLNERGSLTFPSLLFPSFHSLPGSKNQISRIGHSNIYVEQLSFARHYLAQRLSLTSLPLDSGNFIRRAESKNPRKCGVF